MSARTLLDLMGHHFTLWRLANPGPKPLVAAFRAGCEAAKHPALRHALSIYYGHNTEDIMRHQDAMTTKLRQPFTDPLFPVVRHMVAEVLRRPFDRPWSIQGFGMLRTYFGREKQFRLNVWHSRFQVPNVSIVHDHPWDFESWIIAGRFTNVRYTNGTQDLPGISPGASYHVSAAPPNFHCQTIKTGEGGRPVGEVSNVFLIPEQPEVYRPGDRYGQRAQEIHASYYDDGTVTLNDRRRVEDGEHARVFWPLGERWVDAEPRDAHEDEIWIATRAALAWMDAENRPRGSNVG